MAAGMSGTTSCKSASLPISLGLDYERAKTRMRSLTIGKGASPSAVVTVANAAEQWLAGDVAVRRNPKGQALATQRFRDHVMPWLGGLRLVQLTGEDVRGLRLQLEQNTKLALATIGHLLSDLRAFLNWAADAGLIDRSPFPRRVMPRIQERPPDRLSDAEAETLCRQPEPHGFVCRLALGTGLRWAELTRSQASDLDAQGFLVVHHTKSGRLRRVPLEAELLAEVRQRVGRLVGFAVVSPGSFAKAVRTRTRIEGFHVHQMRHTFACQWIEQGRSLPALQQVLGHVSIETTQRYARLTDEAVMRELSVTRSSPRRA